MRPFLKKQPKLLRVVTVTPVLLVAVPLFCAVWLFDKEGQAHPKRILKDTVYMYRECWKEPRG